MHNNTPTNQEREMFDSFLAYQAYPDHIKAQDMFNKYNRVFPELIETQYSCGGCRDRVIWRIKDRMKQYEQSDEQHS